MGQTHAEFFEVYYDNQTDSWEKVRKIPRMKEQIDESVDQANAFIRASWRLFGNGLNS